MQNEKSSIFESQEASIDFSISAEEIKIFGLLSGDKNPIHFDGAFARECGYEREVVFGGLLVAKISQLIGNYFPGPGGVWHSLSIKFLAPLYIGEPARLTCYVSYYNPSLGVLRLDLKVSSDNRSIAKGEAQAGMAKRSEKPQDV